MHSTENIIQWNCQGLNGKKDELLQLIKDQKPAVIAIQETMFGPGNSFRVPHYNFFSKAGTFNQRYHGGVGILIHEDVPVHSEINLSTPLQAIAVQVYLGFNVTICSIYNSRSHTLNKQLLENLLQQLPSPVMLLGDLNAYNTMWGSISTDTRGREVERFLNTSGLNILNDGSNTRIGTISDSAIDLSIISPIINDRLTWSVLPSPYDSDHIPISISYQRASHEQMCSKYNVRRANWSHFSHSEAWNNIDQDLDGTTDEIFQKLLERFDRACQDSMPINSNKGKLYPKTWWSESLTRTRNERESAYRRFKRNPTDQNKMRWKVARAHQRRAIREHKRTSWKSKVNSITVNTRPAELYEFIRNIQGFECRKLHVLKDGNNVYQDKQEIANKLASTLSHTSSTTNYSPAFLQTKTNVENELAGLSFDEESESQYNSNFTIDELNHALKSLKRNSAPGPDEIYNQMITELPQNAKEHLLYLFNKVWSSADLPNFWKESIVIPIPKPGKDHSNALNYRPISLTSSICKLMERMINERLLSFLESKYLLSKYQCGGRKQKSTIDHLVRLETVIRSTFAQREHLIAVSLDIMKAYDMTWKKGIVKDLYDYGVRGKMLKFVDSFLQDRRFRVRLRDVTSPYYPQENGIPQGSVLSPTLFIVKINKILANLPNNNKLNYFLYMDDLLLTASHPNLQNAADLMNESINSVHQWSEINGFKFSPVKSTAVHFARNSGPLEPPNLYLDNSIITYQNSLTFLGMVFDKQLNFKEHIQRLKSKCNKIINLIRTISSLSWGADQESILRVYRTLIRSRLDYGSIVYNSASATNLKSIDPIANECLRLASGAFKSTPVPSLQVICSEQSLYLRRDYLSSRYYLKIRSLINNPAFKSVVDTSNETTFTARNEPTGLSIRVKNCNTNLNLRRLLIKPSTRQYIFQSSPRWKIQCPSIDMSLSEFPKATTPPIIYRAEFTKLIREKYPQCKQIYTDGSKSRIGVGAAAIHENTSRTLSLPLNSSIFTAECKAIDLALLMITELNLTYALICSDSKSALQSIGNKWSQNPLAFDIIMNIEKLTGEGRQINLIWIPGHVEIKGNEKADIKAKFASETPSSLLPLPYTDYFPTLKEIFKDKWTTQWRASGQKLLKVKDSVDKWARQTGFNRRDEVVLNRLRAGHTALTHGYLMSGVPTPPVCCLCRDAVISVEHVFLECPELSDIRNHYLGTNPNLKSLLGREISLQTYNFIRATGLYNAA